LTATRCEPGNRTATAARPVSRRLRGDRLALAVVILAAALVGCGRIFAFEVTADEAFSWTMSRYPVVELLRRLGDDAHPPLHYLALKGWSAVFGGSLASLRGLSVFLWCVALVAMDRLVGLVRAGESPGPGDANWCGVLAAALMVVSPLQAEGAAVFRMYAPGLCLSAVNAALFLSLARAPRGRPLAWAAYVATTTAFALTHYYAFFTLMAAALVVGLVAVSGRRRRAETSALVSRFALAWFAASLLYLPWLPSHLGQVRSVVAGFWIPELTGSDLEKLALHYLTGLPGRDRWLDAAAMATAGVVLGVTAARLDLGRGLILALIAVPWAGGIVFSLLTRRTILLDRYLLFSHQYYLAAIALAVAAAPGRAVRAVLAALAVLGGLYATAREAESGHGRGKSLEPLARRIAVDSRPRQVVVTGELAKALQLRYYLDRHGVACPLRVVGAPTTVGGHRVYLAAVRRDTWLNPRDIATLPCDWIWFVESDKSKLAEPPRGWNAVRSTPFITMHAPRMILHLYQRTAPSSR
jgi:hypothetical protein